jgi:hypothetical protein
MVAWGVIVWGLFALAQEGPLPGSAEAEADAAIAEFKREFNRPNATEDERVLAVRTLGKAAHAKTLAVLSPLIYERSGAPNCIRIAAALVLSNFGKVDGTVDALKKAYMGNGKPGSRPVRIQVIQTIGELKAEDAAGFINTAIMDRDPWIARAAAKAAGRLRGSASIDPLIRRLQYLESRDGDKPASDVPDPTRDPGDALERHKKSERQVLEAPIHQALTSITRKTHSCAKEWAVWWAQNRKDFKVPP